jgi:hypothetical protein
MFVTPQKQGRPLPTLRPPVGATDREPLGTAQARHFDSTAMRRPIDMPSQLDRYISQAPVASSRTMSDVSTTAISATRQAARCSRRSIHRPCWSCYGPSGIPDFLATSTANAGLEIRKSRRRSTKKPSIGETLALRIVYSDNKQSSLLTAGSRKISSNFFPFDNAAPTRQWHGRRTRAPACGVSPTI